MVLLRFAPSPTGPLHLGGLRMALYNFLYARKHSGKWILRIEDTDKTRVVPGSVQGIQEALRWAGLDYDYGPEKDGPMGPFYQSERLDLYRAFASKLLDSGHAYRCFCTPDKLSQTRERLAKSGSQMSYDRSCLHLSEEEAARKVRAGEKYIVRLNDDMIPSRPAYTDFVFGTIRDTHASTSTDTVLLKSDSFPTYHLASVVDDHEMGITHVLRGEEWLPSLYLHLNIYTSLNITPPKFAHIPILLNADGTKMSKRNGDVQVIDYIRRGWEPQAILNWLALAGWGTGHDLDSNTASDNNQRAQAPESTRVMNFDELMDEFDLSVITQRSSALDIKKLEYINKHHLMNAWSTEEGLNSLANRVHLELKEQFPACEFTTVDYIKKVILLLEGRLANIRDIPVLAPFMFRVPDWGSDESKRMLQKIPSGQYAKILRAVDGNLADLEEKATQQSERLRVLLWDTNQRLLGVSHKSFMMALRHALCGMKDGPAVADTMAVLGGNRVRERLRNALSYTCNGDDGSIASV